MNKRLKVLNVIPDLGTGGGEKIALDICTFLNRDEFDVILVSLYASRNNIYEQIAHESNVKVVYLNKKPGFDLKLFFDFNRLTKLLKPDIIHTHLYIFPYVLPSLIINRTKARVHTVHNIASRELRYLGKYIMRVAYRYFNVVPVAISDYVRTTIEDEYSIDSNSIFCVYNGIDTKRFRRKRIPTNDFVTFIHVGRFSKQKNHNLLIDAFGEAFKECKNIRLKLVGDGELKNQISDKVIKYGIAEGVIFKGIQKDVSIELNNSDVFILSSDWEGLPLSILEAMSCGLPIISTKAGGIPDIVEDSENGIIVDVGDKRGLTRAIIKLSRDRKLREEMGNKSYIISRKYDIREMCIGYSEIYKTLCSAAPPPRTHNCAYRSTL